jgi:hypothetical protein
MPSEEANRTPQLSSYIYAVGIIDIQALTDGFTSIKASLTEF